MESPCSHAPAPVMWVSGSWHFFGPSEMVQSTHCAEEPEVRREKFNAAKSGTKRDKEPRYMQGASWNRSGNVQRVIHTGTLVNGAAAQTRSQRQSGVFRGVRRSIDPTATPSI